MQLIQYFYGNMKIPQDNALLQSTGGKH